jgi:hypothetical protein
MCIESCEYNPKGVAVSPLQPNPPLRKAESSNFVMSTLNVQGRTPLGQSKKDLFKLKLAQKSSEYSHSGIIMFTLYCYYRSPSHELDQLKQS